MWKDHGNTGTTGNYLSGSITSQTVVSFSPFTLASATSKNPLPVELISFQAIKAGQHVDILWTTQSEINCDYYVVQRSGDGIKFDDFSQVNGAGSSNEILDYKIIDLSPLSGISYYRLKQFDYNGNTQYSDLEKIDFLRGIGNLIRFYPNPTRDWVTIDVSQTQYTDLEYFVYDAVGKLVSSGRLSDVKALNLTQIGSSELYFISISSREFGPVFSRKIVVY